MARKTQLEQYLELEYTFVELVRDSKGRVSHIVVGENVNRQHLVPYVFDIREKDYFNKSRVYQPHELYSKIKEGKVTFQ